MNIREILLESVLGEAIMSTRDRADNLIDRKMKKLGIHGAKVTKKIGFTSYKIGQWTIINDGVGLIVKKGSKEIEYFDRPMMNYSKALEMVQE